MGEAVNRKKMALGGPRGLAVLACFGIVAAGCASAKTERTAQVAVPETQAEVVSPRLLEVTSVELYEGAPGTRVKVRATGELIWTSYRNAAGELVVELPNSVLAAGVDSELQGVGVVSRVRVETENGSSRPLTRLVVVAAGETEHSIAADPTGLSLELLPVPEPTATAAVREAAPAPTPAPEASPVVAPIAYREPADPASQKPPVERAPSLAPARPATRLSGIEVLAQGENTAIQILGDGEISYESFRLEDPPRLVLDLGGVVNAAPRGVWVLDGVVVNRVRVSQFRPHPEAVTRVVLDLASAREPSIEKGSRGLLLRFGPTAAAPPPPQPTLVESVAVAAREEAPLSQPASEEPGRTPVEAPQEAVAAAPPPSPAVASDVQAFGGTPERPREVARAPVPVSTFEAADVQPPQGSAPPVASEPQRPAAASVPGQRKEYVGDPISLDLKDADVRDVLRSFAKISGLNIVVQPGVRGTVTVLLEGVPWDQALDQILKINGLAYELDGNIMRIAPIATLEAEARKAQQLAQAQALSVPLRTVVKRLSYSTAQEMSRILQTGGRGGGGILSQRGSVTIDSRTNTLIIKELPNFIDTVIAVIETLDIPEPQVMIEARIAETTKRFSRSLGIRWGFSAIADPAFGNSTGLVFPNNVESTGGVSLLTGGANGFINLALGNVLDTFQLDARLQAAEAEGLINVISAPKIATLNNEVATIQSGLQIPIQTVANNTVSVQFVNATLSLQVTPHVTAEGTVLMDINLQKREPQLAFAVVGATNAPIATKEARTRVIVRDGGTTVIGGIYEVTSDQGQDRVPGLSNVPLLGHLFKNRRRLDENKELLIFITPRVIKL